jgi:uncharacterized protein YndB with AHSA1/START domain
MPYSFILTATIPASPQEVYDAWLDSRAHSAMTGGKATQSADVGAAVTAWDDYITGNNVELVPGKRIVQTWRTTEFTDEHGDSVIIVTLDPVSGGSQLTLEHTNVPDEHTSYEESGWREHYFEPMQRYFMTAAKVAAVRAGARKAKKAAAKTSAKKTSAKKVPAKKKAAARKKTAVKKSVKKTVKKKAAKKKSTTKKSKAKKRVPARKKSRRR